MPDVLQIAALMCSRVCHDLISPVSALNNGLEVLNEDDDPEMRAHAMDLIAHSGHQASMKLQFARLAFGASSFAADRLPFSEAQAVLDTLLPGKKVSTSWSGVDREVDKSIIKILMNLAIIAADIIPYGGTLTFECSPQERNTEFNIIAVGERARLRPDVKAALFGDVSPEELNPQSIQPFVAGLLVRDASLLLETEVAQASVTLRVKQG